MSSYIVKFKYIHSLHFEKCLGSPIITFSIMFSIIDLHDQRLIIYKCIYLSNVAQSMGDGKHITECHLAKTIADCIII